MTSGSSSSARADPGEHGGAQPVARTLLHLEAEPDRRGEVAGQFDGPVDAAVVDDQHPRAAADQVEHAGALVHLAEHRGDRVRLVARRQDDDARLGEEQVGHGFRCRCDDRQTPDGPGDQRVGREGFEPPKDDAG